MYRSLAEPLGAYIEGRKLKSADLVVTVSQGLAERLIAIGAARDRLAVVPNTVPDGRVTASAKRSSDSKVVGWIGHLMSWHADALLMLVDAAPNVLAREPNIRFRIIGDGPRLPEVRARARDRGVDGSIDFVGAVPYENVPEALEHVDFGVIPDVFDYAFPVKLVEMGAAGMAVISPHSRELDTMLRPNVEYRPFARRDSGQLVDAIVDLARDTARRDRLASGLHEVVASRYTWSAVATQLRSLVERVVEA
jgi:glycosyltransferase involved in cell wall biosynthesis